MGIFTERLALRLKQLDMKQLELAEKVKATPTSVSRYMTGAALPGLETFVRIAEALEVTPDYLLGYQDEPTPKHPQPEEPSKIAFHKLASEPIYEEAEFISMEKETEEVTDSVMLSLNELNVAAYVCAKSFGETFGASADVMHLLDVLVKITTMIRHRIGIYNLITQREIAMSAKSEQDKMFLREKSLMKMNVSAAIRGLQFLVRENERKEVGVHFGELLDDAGGLKPL